MKFKCGKTQAEQLAADIKTYEAVRNLLINGRVVFAWLPVEVAKGECHWLEKAVETYELLTWSERKQDIIASAQTPADLPEATVTSFWRGTELRVCGYKAYDS